MTDAQTPVLSDRDRGHLKRAIALSEEAFEAGDRPFGAVLVAADGTVLSEAWCSIWSVGDPTVHAELYAIRKASQLRPAPDLSTATMYASSEPCPMCASAIYWSGIPRLVFGASQARFAALREAQSDGGGGSGGGLKLACREVFARGGREIEVLGPVLEDEAMEVHARFWGPNAH